MDPLEHAQQLNRRQFLKRSNLGLGAIALGTLGMSCESVLANTENSDRSILADFAQSETSHLHVSVRCPHHSLSCLIRSPNSGLQRTELPDSIRMDNG